MLGAQQGPMDMLMYYDARVNTSFNGLFDFYTLRPLKGYYPFKMFNERYTLGRSVRVEVTGDKLYAAAAKGDNGESALMLACYTDDDTDTAVREVTFDLVDGAYCDGKIDQKKRTIGWVNFNRCCRGGKPPLLAFLVILC